MGAGRKHEIPISETTDCMTHSTASSMNINMFALVALAAKSQESDTKKWARQMLCTQWVCVAAEEH